MLVTYGYQSNVLFREMYSVSDGVRWRHRVAGVLTLGFSPLRYLSIETQVIISQRGMT